MLMVTGWKMDRIKIIRVVCILGFMQFLVTGISASDMMFRYNAAHTGDYSPIAGSVGTKVSLLWSNTTGNAVLSSPAVADGIVYAGSNDHNVYAFNATTGALKWSYPTGNWVCSSPAVVNGVVYVGSWDHNIYALNAATGALKWSYPTGSFVESSPVVANGTVYVGSFDGNVYALNATTGAKIWKYSTGDLVYSSPAVANGVVYVGNYIKGNVFALDARSGAKKWNYSIGNIVVGSPAVANGTVYIGSFDKNLYALNAATGALKWSYPTGGYVYSSPAVANGTVYVGSDDNKVYALDATSGALKWSYPTGNCTESSPAFANGIVYVGSWDHKVYALNGATGAKIWDYSTGDSTQAGPAVANGIVYVGNSNGRIYALNTVPLSVNGITPTFGKLGTMVSATIGGTGFSAGDQVRLTRTGQLPIIGTGIVVVSPTQITCNFDISPTTAIGLRNVRVFSSSQNALKLAAFWVKTVSPPTVTSITPVSGRRGTTVSITNLAGTGFKKSGNNQPKVQLINGTTTLTATDVVTTGSTKIACQFALPANATVGVWNVRVTNPDNQAGTKAGAFTVNV